MFLEVFYLMWQAKLTHQRSQIIIIMYVQISYCSKYGNQWSSLFVTSSGFLQSVQMKVNPHGYPSFMKTYVGETRYWERIVSSISLYIYKHHICSYFSLICVWLSSKYPLNLWTLIRTTWVKAHGFWKQKMEHHGPWRSYEKEQNISSAERIGRSSQSITTYDSETRSWLFLWEILCLKLCFTTKLLVARFWIPTLTILLMNHQRSMKLQEMAGNTRGSMNFATSQKVQISKKKSLTPRM